MGDVGLVLAAHVIVEDFILELSVSREAWRCVQCLHRHSTFSSRSIQELYYLHRLLYGEAVSFWFFCMGEKIRVHCNDLGLQSSPPQKGLNLAALFHM